MTIKPTTWREAIRAANPDLLVPVIRLPFHLTGRTPLRAVMRYGNAKPTAVLPGVRTRRVTVGTSQVPVTIHEPDVRAAPSGALVWCFGGGLISGSAEHANDVASYLARTHGIIVVVPNYRLAPEYPYPAAIDDCFAALEWIVANAGHLGVFVDRIAVGGDSAGAGLAAAMAQRAHDESIALCVQLLTYPMLDDRTVLRAEANREVYLTWTVPSNRYGWASYLGHAPGDGESRPYAVPARRANLHGLAPAWIGVGDIDQFYDECLDYAERLKAAGVPCDLRVVPGMYHGADVMRPNHPLIVGLRESRDAALRKAMASSDN
ncbi:alpha/beta hydrolase [Microbacterium oleivorans]|uniref:Alpha/beta hydrolase fold domain-containing protein n=1 Tax=Microbacterium oleivorans TaxID=273677 RepID=A0A7D5IU59_9MICO|nr:alpha/beta hydrolase fold domain-containing protein [Microbacterium oleivorans]QLD12754.1 alpha/beta hydrolase fold domain-containing protein [Microbacterium oleivorans]